MAGVVGLEVLHEAECAKCTEEQPMPTGTWPLQVHSAKRGSGKVAFRRL